MKKKVGVLLIIGGLGIVGYYLLTLKKPTNKEQQLLELDKKAKDLSDSMIDIDDSAITKAKSIQSELLKIWAIDKSKRTPQDEGRVTTLLNQLKNLNYTLIGTELRINR